MNVVHPADLEAQADDYVSSIPKDIIFSLLTCGIYALFWQARQIRAVNYLIAKERFGFWKWFLLSIVTCGIYAVYHEYVMAEAIQDAQRGLGRPVADSLPLVSVVVSIFGLLLVADAIQQSEINRIFGRE